MFVFVAIITGIILARGKSQDPDVVSEIHKEVEVTLLSSDLDSNSWTQYQHELGLTFRYPSRVQLTRNNDSDLPTDIYLRDSETGRFMLIEIFSEKEPYNRGNGFKASSLYEFASAYWLDTKNWLSNVREKEQREVYVSDLKKTDIPFADSHHFSSDYGVWGASTGVDPVTALFLEDSLGTRYAIFYDDIQVFEKILTLMKIP